MTQPPAHTESAHATACAHCGLPVLRSRADEPHGSAAGSAVEDAAFCCLGCRVAYHAIRGAGFDDTYYRMRRLAGDASRKPTRASSAALTLQYLDSPGFVEDHGTVLDDGSCEVSLHVDGMHCAACSWLVEQVATREGGVQGVDVDLPRTAVRLRYDPGTLSLSALARRLQSFGYALQPRSAVRDASSTSRSLLIRTGVSWAIAGNIMLLAFAFYSGLDIVEQPALANAGRWASFILGIGSLAVGGTVFFRRAFASVAMAIRHRSLLRLHMDVPISLGIIVGFAHSAWNTVQGTGELWFDSIAVLIAALLTARWLQTRGQQRAAEASDRLFSVIPHVARRLDADGKEDVVRVDSLAPGDLIRVEVGESCPVDGRIVSGRSHFNESVLTGESRPVAREAGQEASAGTINLGSTVVVRATTAGDDSQVGRMLRWLENNRQREAHVVQMADRLAGWFVLGVIAVAATTGFAGASLFPDEAVNRVVALLVIACPCALGMATPLAMVTARGRAARLGTLVKDDASVEALSSVDVIVFDKTGTVTTGELVLEESAGDKAVLSLAAAVEADSRHPISSTIRDLATDENVVASSIEEHWGAGVCGEVNARSVVVGKPAWVRSQADDPENLMEVAESFARRGDTPVAVSVDGTIRLVMAFGDPLRDDAASSLAALRASGKRLILLSGDHPDVVARVGEKLGFSRSDVSGGATPRDKERYVVELRRSATVAMVGDGINDASAMRAADVGIALGTKNAPAVVAADVLVNADSVTAVDAMVDLAHNTRTVVRANLTFSLVYNVFGAAAAAIGYVTPLVAAVAMPVSSLVVVSSSLLLNYSRRLR